VCGVNAKKGKHSATNDRLRNADAIIEALGGSTSDETVSKARNPGITVIRGYETSCP